MIEEQNTNTDRVIYCDELIKTFISGVKAEQIEECIEKIITSNPDTIFSTIQYSKRDRRLYFYTDCIINTQAWSKPKNPIPRVIMTTVDVLEEIKRILLDEKKDENSCLSIYDRDDVITLDEVINQTRTMKSKYEKVKDLYEEKLKYAYSMKEGSSSHICISDFDFETNEIKVSFTPYSLGNYTYCRFKKAEDGDLKGTRESGYHDLDDIMLPCGTIIKEAYEELIKFKDFKSQIKRNVRSLNSRFNIEIDNYGVEVKSASNVFKLYFRSYSTDDKYECNSQNIIDVLKGKELDFAKKILVRIEDCPEWMHGNLYEIRERELNAIKEQQKKEEQLKIKEQEKLKKQEEKTEKLKTLKKRFFPFIKSKSN